MDATLSFLLNQSKDFFCAVDRNGFIRHTNAALRKSLGYSEQEITGKQISAFFHPADIKRKDEVLTKLYQKKEVTGYECRIKAIDGRYYNIKCSLIFNPEDGLVYATGTNLTNKLNTTSQSNITDNIQHIIQSFSEGFFIMDANWQIIAFNPAFQAITGLKARQIKNLNFRNLHTLGITAEVTDEFENAFKVNVSSQVQYFNAYSKRWLRINVYPYKNEVVVFIRDITNIKIQQLVLALERKVLEMHATGNYSLSQTITELLSGIEEIFPDMVCSVLELNEEQERLFHLSAPRLPEEYCNAINGAAIGPKAGSCGTAAYHRNQVIVSNIEKDPLWEDYRELIRPYGLKACWSTPIISANSAHVLATFAVYYATTREPKMDELNIISRTANILRVLIENKRSLERVKEQNTRLQEIASISSHEIRRPVATILGLVNLFDHSNMDNPLNREIINHLNSTAKELDNVIHAIVEKTIYLKGEGL
ncbi:MAG: fold protein [Mucilaginibacter sp.]|nr:fold protein [Mucilaginibacter sp.]